MANSRRRGIMAMEYYSAPPTDQGFIKGVEDLGYKIDERGQIAPELPIENAIFTQPLYPEHFNPAVKPGMRITGPGAGTGEGTNFYANPTLENKPATRPPGWHQHPATGHGGLLNSLAGVVTGLAMMDLTSSDEELFVVPDMEDSLLEVSAALEQLVALEHQIQDISYLKEDVTKTGGMCKQFAMEAQKHLPQFGGVPLTHYTEMPTATRYKVALEELSKGIWAAIAAGIAIVLAVIGKFVFWMLGRKGDGEGGGSGGSSGGSASSSGAVTGSDMKKAVEVAKKMPEEVKQMARTMDVGQKAVNKAEGLLTHANITLINEHGKKYPVHSFQDIIENVLTDTERFQRAKEFLDNRDAYTHDIINGGDFSKMMASVSALLGGVCGALTIKTETLEQVMRRDLGSHSVDDEVKNNASLSAVAKPIEITVAGSTMSLRQAADFLADKRKELKDKGVSNPVMFDKLFTTMHRTYESHTIDSIMHQGYTVTDCLANVTGRLEKMRDASRNLSTDGVPGALTQDIGEKVRRTLSLVREETVALTMIAGEITVFFHVLEELAKSALGFGVEVVKKSAKLMKDQGIPVPEGWKEVLEELNEQHKAITAGYFSLRR